MSNFKMKLDVQDWGCIDYSEALTHQLKLVSDVFSHDKIGVVAYCSHPPIVTIGRSVQKEDVFGWEGPIIEVGRGGRATYHGPSQLIVYPIINLKKSQNVAGLMRLLEKTVVETLLEYKIQACGRTKLDSGPNETLNDTGVWIANRKIASIGIGVKNWVSYHGLAINISRDNRAFQGIKPCGFDSSVMTSLEEILDRPVDSLEFRKYFENHLFQQLEFFLNESFLIG